MVRKFSVNWAIWQKWIYQKCLILLHYDFLWQLSNLTENLKKPCFSAIILLIHHFWSFLWTLTVLWMLLKWKVLFYFSGICWQPSLKKFRFLTCQIALAGSSHRISANAQLSKKIITYQNHAFWYNYLLIYFFFNLSIICGVTGKKHGFSRFSV